MTFAISSSFRMGDFASRYERKLDVSLFGLAGALVSVENLLYDQQ